MSGNKMIAEERRRALQVCTMDVFYDYFNEREELEMKEAKGERKK